MSDTVNATNIQRLFVLVAILGLGVCLGVLIPHVAKDSASNHGQALDSDLTAVNPDESPRDQIGVLETVARRGTRTELGSDPNVVQAVFSTQDPESHELGCLLQARPAGISLPDVMPSAEECVDSTVLNPLGVIPDHEQMKVLRGQIERANEDLMNSVRAASIEMSSWVTEKVRLGDCVAYSDDSPFEPEGKGEATSIYSSYDGSSFRVRVYPGECASVDVLYDDTWRIALHEQIRVRDLIGSFVKK